MREHDPVRAGDHGLGGRPPQPGARQRGAPRPSRRVRARHAARPGGADHRPADRPRLAEGRAEHLPHRRGRVLRRGRVRARPLVRRRRRARARQRADPRAPRAPRAHRLADRPLQPPLLPRAAALGAAARRPRARHGRADDARHRRLQARERRLRARARATRCSSAIADVLLRSTVRAFRHRLPRRRRGVRGDPALVLDGGRARHRRAPDGRARRNLGRCRRRDHPVRRRRARARACDERARAVRLRRVGDDDREGAGEGPRRRLRGPPRGAPARR